MEEDVSIFYFYQCIFVSKVRVEIDAYLLFLYFTGCNIMIVSISGRKSEHTCTPITIVRSARVVFAITFLINDKSDNPAPVSLFFGLYSDIFIEKDEVIQIKWTSQLNNTQSQLRIVYVSELCRKGPRSCDLIDKITRQCLWCFFCLISLNPGHVNDSFLLILRMFYIFSSTRKKPPIFAQV